MLFDQRYCNIFFRFRTSKFHVLPTKLHMKFALLSVLWLNPHIIIHIEDEVVMHHIDPLFQSIHAFIRTNGYE